MSSPYLFKLADPSSSRSRQGAGLLSQPSSSPDLIPSNGFNGATDTTTGIQVVDVVNQFEWTHTPNIGRHEVPYIRLSEYSVKFNSLMQNISYLLSIGAEGGKALADDVSKGVGISPDNILTKAVEGTGVIGKTVGAAVLASVNVDINNIAKYLHPYVGLYGVLPTGFEYYFPYFSTTWKDTDTDWGETAGGGVFAPILEMFGKRGYASMITDTLAVDKDVVGAYIEAPKMFSYKDAGPSHSFTITLLNTTNTDDVIRNWHLAFMLAYQNLPNRTSKILLEPPVVYEVEIPGLFYTPYAYIKTLKIINRGAVRVMKIPYKLEAPVTSRGSTSAPSNTTNEIQSRYSSDTISMNNFRSKSWSSQVDVVGDDKINTQYVEAIIPDAYQIDITIQSLLPESKNLLFHSILGSGTMNSGTYNAILKAPSGEKYKTSETITNSIAEKIYTPAPNAK